MCKDGLSAKPMYAGTVLFSLDFSPSECLFYRSCDKFVRNLTVISQEFLSSLFRICLKSVSYIRIVLAAHPTSAMHMDR